MRTQSYIVSINEPFLKTAFESFVTSMGIKVKKVYPEMAESKDEEDNSISALFGTWTDDVIDAKELRKNAWNRKTAVFLAG